jgi:hypothetical protein
MVKLHLVGFSSDLKSLVFSTRRGAKSGTYTVDVNPRLKRTLEEIESRQTESDDETVVEEAKPARRGPSRPERPSVPPSKISPKEIQSLLREGKTPDEVAQIAEADVSWIERFTSPIIAERAVVVDIVKTARIARLRRGLSSLPVGEAILANLADKKVWLSPEEFDEGWNAVRREGQWEVTFAYRSRRREMDAGFVVDHERNVRATNPQAAALGWRAAPGEEDDDEDLSVERTSPAPVEPAAPAAEVLPPDSASPAPPGEGLSEAAGPGPQAAVSDVSPRRQAAVPASAPRAVVSQRPGTPSGPTPRGWSLPARRVPESRPASPDLPASDASASRSSPPAGLARRPSPPRGSGPDRPAQPAARTASARAVKPASSRSGEAPRTTEGGNATSARLARNGEPVTKEQAAPPTPQPPALIQGTPASRLKAPGRPTSAAAAPKTSAASKTAASSSRRSAPASRPAPAVPKQRTAAASAPGSSARRRREPTPPLRPGQAVSLADVGWSLPADRGVGRPPAEKDPSGR